MESTPVVLNSSKVSSVRGEALSQLAILKREMKLGNLTTGVRRVTLWDGSLVLCSSCYGIDTVEILKPAIEIDNKVLTPYYEVTIESDIVTGTVLNVDKVTPLDAESLPVSNIVVDSVLRFIKTIIKVVSSDIRCHGLVKIISEKHFPILVDVVSKSIAVVHTVRTERVITDVVVSALYETSAQEKELAYMGGYFASTKDKITIVPGVAIYSEHSVYVRFPNGDEYAYDAYLKGWRYIYKQANTEHIEITGVPEIDKSLYGTVSAVGVYTLDVGVGTTSTKDFRFDVHPFILTVQKGVPVISVSFTQTTIRVGETIAGIVNYPNGVDASIISHNTAITATLQTYAGSKTYNSVTKIWSQTFFIAGVTEGPAAFNVSTVANAMYESAVVVTKYLTVKVRGVYLEYAAQGSYANGRVYARGGSGSYTLTLKSYNGTGVGVVADSYTNFHYIYLSAWSAGACLNPGDYWRISDKNDASNYVDLYALSWINLITPKPAISDCSTKPPLSIAVAWLRVEPDVSPGWYIYYTLNLVGSETSGNATYTTRDALHPFADVTIAGTYTYNAATKALVVLLSYYTYSFTMSEDGETLTNTYLGSFYRP